MLSVLCEDIGIQNFCFIGKQRGADWFLWAHLRYIAPNAEVQPAIVEFVGQPSVAGVRSCENYGMFNKLEMRPFQRLAKGKTA